MAHDYEPSSGCPEDPKGEAAQALYFTHVLTLYRELTGTDEKREVLDGSTDIDRLIESRAKAKQNGHADPDQEREDLWASSVRTYHSRRREDLRAAWREYHTRMAESIERTARELAAEHREKAEQLMTNEPRGAV